MNVDEFKGCCQEYLVQKKMINDLIQNHNYLFKGPSVGLDVDAYDRLEIDQEIQEYKLVLLKSNVKCVEVGFETIENKLGTEVKEILWDSLVERKSHNELSEKYNYSVRTIERRIAQFDEQVL